MDRFTEEPAANMERNYREAQQGEDYDDGGDPPYCCACNGRRWVVRCIDDLCYGQDECIHGDPPSPCWECNRNGELEDGLY